jgi:hypothetical protein
LLTGILIHWAIERPLVAFGRALRGRLAPRPVAAPVRALQ